MNSKEPAILTLRKQPEPLSCPGGRKVFLDLGAADLGFGAGARRAGGGLSCKGLMGGWELASRGELSGKSTHAAFFISKAL